MAKYRFLGHDTVASCSSCVFGKLSLDRTQVLCQKRGVTNPTYHCKKYEYSPLSRMPQPTKTLFENESFSIEDFIL